MFERLRYTMVPLSLRQRFSSTLVAILVKLKGKGDGQTTETARSQP